MVKIPKHEDLSSFDEMMNMADRQIEEKQAEQDIVDRVLELRQLHTDIDQTTTTFVNATLELESAIQKYNHAEINLNAAVKNIGDKVNTINTHIDDVIKNAPDKLKVTVHATDADMKLIQNMFATEHKWMLGQMQKHIREVNEMFVAERKHTDYHYKETEGIYFGHRMQWFFLTFYYIGIFIVVGLIAMAVANAAGWAK